MYLFRINPRSLRVRLLLILFLGIICTISVSFYVQLKNSQKWIREDEQRNTYLLSSVLYSILEHTMAKGRVEEVTRALQSIVKSPTITTIQILDRYKNPKFSAGIGESKANGNTLIIPISPKPLCRKCHGDINPIGYLKIGFDTSEYRKRFIRELTTNIGTSLAVLLSLTIMIYICLEKGIFSRLQKINVAMQYFGKGNLKYRIKVEGEDELSSMARAFNEMARNIYKINYRLYKVSEFSTILNRCLSEEEVFTRTVRFLKRFFDINGVVIIVNDTKEEIVASEGSMEGIQYVEPITLGDRETGFIKVAVSRDMTVEEISAIKIIASSVAMALERIKSS